MKYYRDLPAFEFFYSGDSVVVYGIEEKLAEKLKREGVKFHIEAW
jgi:hypothetical protein